MPQTLTPKSKSEPTHLRRSPRLQHPNPNNHNFRYNEIVSHSLSIKTPTARFSPNELPIVCGLKPSVGSNDCGKLRDGLVKGCGLGNGVVGNRRSSRNWVRIGAIDGGSVEGKSGFETPLNGWRGEGNWGSGGSGLRSRGEGLEGLRRSTRIRKQCSGSMELIGNTGHGSSFRDVNGGAEKRLTRSSVARLSVELDDKKEVNTTGIKGKDTRGHESRQSESGKARCGAVSLGDIPKINQKCRGFETPLNDWRGNVNGFGGGSTFRCQVEGIEGLRRSSRLLEKCSSIELVGKRCNGDVDKDVNGGFGKRLTRSSVADSGIELDQKKVVSGSRMKRILEGGYESGQTNVGESERKKCGAVSSSVTPETSKTIARRRTCSKSEVNEIVEIQGLRRSPRLLDRKNAQKAVTVAHDTKPIQSTICELESKQVVRREKEGIQSRRKRRSTVADLAIEPEGMTKVCSTKDKQGGNEVCCVYEDACATPVSGKITVQIKANGLKVTGKKRKRKQVYRVDQGWTGEQLSALQRAYFAAKPTPHFWKKVAKMVPGKSAQDCFDRVNSEKLTPSLPPPHPRLKPRIPSLSPGFSYSPCKLFRFMEPKNKRVRTIKRKSHIAQKTARHLLQKLSHVCQNGEADLFSLLEPNVNLVNEVVQHTPSHATPIRTIRNLGSSPVLVQSLSASCKRALYRFSGANEAPLVSPPVLKPIKNLALHEKYIDHLHSREAKRTAASTRNVKHSSIKRQNQGSLRNGNIVQTAKSALVSDARDAISRFQHLQANLIEDSPEPEENLDDADEMIPEEASLFSPLRNYRL
ncbi:hypothetical protein AKJ16_DCAP16083 [Drosera capensis]